MSQRNFIQFGTMALSFLFVSYFWIIPTVQAESSQAGIPPEKVAEYLHSVIEADRTLYTTHVVQRMQEQDIVSASETWKKQNSLPLPAQMLTLAGLHVRQKGDGIQYRLASLWPIYEKNRPKSEFERSGLEAVASDPSRPYTGFITKEKKRFFTAIYADKAISKACVDCHNNHPLSPKRDYKLNRVMGGIIISFPVPAEEKP